VWRRRAAAARSVPDSARPRFPALLVTWITRPSQLKPPVTGQRQDDGATEGPTERPRWGAAVPASATARLRRSLAATSRPPLGAEAAAELIRHDSLAGRSSPTPRGISSAWGNTKAGRLVPTRPVGRCSRRVHPHHSTLGLHRCRNRPRISAPDRAPGFSTQVQRRPALVPGHRHRRPRPDDKPAGPPCRKPLPVDGHPASQSGAVRA
jgi:hypothetical protein